MKLKLERSSYREIGQHEHNGPSFQRVTPAAKRFAFGDVANGGAVRLMAMHEISERLESGKGTHLDIARAQSDVKGLQRSPGTSPAQRERFPALDNAVAVGAQLVHIVHPYLHAVSYLSGLISLLAVRGPTYAVIADKVEVSMDTGISLEIGTRLPLLVGPAGKALLNELTDAEDEDTFFEIQSLKSTCRAFEEESEIREAVLRGLGERVGGYIEEDAQGVITLAVPVCVRKLGVHAAVLAVGSKPRWRDGRVFSVWKFLTEIAAALYCRL